MRKKMKHYDLQLMINMIHFEMSNGVQLDFRFLQDEGALFFLILLDNKLCSFPSILKVEQYVTRMSRYVLGSVFETI